MNLVWGFGVRVEHFDALSDCPKHTLQFRSFSRSTVHSLLKSVVAELINDVTPASFTGAITTSFQMYDFRFDVLFGNPILVIVSWKRFLVILFHLCSLFVHTTDCSPGHAAA